MGKQYLCKYFVIDDHIVVFVPLGVFNKMVERFFFWSCNVDLYGEDVFIEEYKANMFYPTLSVDFDKHKKVHSLMRSSCLSSKVKIEAQIHGEFDIAT